MWAHLRRRGLRWAEATKPRQEVHCSIITMIDYSLRLLLLAALIPTGFNLRLRVRDVAIPTGKDDLPLPRDARDAAIFAEWCARIDKQVEKCAQQTRHARSEYAKSRRATDAEDKNLSQRMRRLLDEQKRIERKLHDLSIQ